ncbi:hypothetical protein KP509_1Z242100 [Ceratopteris richardii]|nr:hypothetical protein KP509_1Z242100 [Ceratopteris richardii]
MFLGCALLNMYAKCGAVGNVEEVFDELSVRDVVVWTALIDAYAQLRHGEKSLHNFERMQCEGVSPNAVTFLCTVKACTSIGAAEKGDELYARILGQGFLREKPELGNTFIDMYAKCGSLIKAKGVFDELPMRTVASWNSLITGYAQHGYAKEALEYFDKMKNDNFIHNEVTYLGALRACSGLETFEKGIEIHSEVVRRGLLCTSDLANSLIDMYVKCGAFQSAQQVFDELPVKTVVSWNALISGYVLNGLHEDALIYIDQLQEEGFCPDAVTFLWMMKVYGSIGATEKGEALHTEMVRRSMLENNYVLSNALLDMHAKCGVIRRAEQVFNQLPSPDVVAWTALLAGYVQAGESGAAFCLFARMIKEGSRPNMVTFVVLLTACSHAAVAEEGRSYYEMMATMYGIVPASEHATCIVDLLSKSGCVEKAITIINRLPLTNYLPAWLSLLGACRMWGNINFGRLAFEHVLRLNKSTAIAYMYMSDIYKQVGLQKHAK